MTTNVILKKTLVVLKLIGKTISVDLEAVEISSCSKANLVACARDYWAMAQTAERWLASNYPIKREAALRIAKSVIIEDICFVHDYHPNIL